jgi:hypothetical protein
VLEQAVAELNQADFLVGENVSSPLIIPSSLLSAARPLVKERDSFGVLLFLVFNDEFQLFVVGVNRQFRAAAILSWVADQEIESVVTLCLSLENKVAKVNDIILVSAVHSHASIEVPSLIFPGKVSPTLCIERPQSPRFSSADRT